MFCFETMKLLHTIETYTQSNYTKMNLLTKLFLFVTHFIGPLHQVYLSKTQHRKNSALSNETKQYRIKII